ncbi:hypothetical protein EV666_10317 [Camelimonas lactis]|uniref:HAD superfamily hydrolase (TIGR01549 family) n=2 Tax=Camelimonas lactis TaxID=659006 RepID=A0A4R2GXU9_9HYPH|nr:hypothetical protein EV666_10317 [Camelimonas lactis]
MAFLRARRRGEPVLSTAPESRSPQIVAFDRGWFDPDYYLNQEPKLEGIDVDPFTHYVTIGWRQNRNPHPLFDVQWWLKHHPPGPDGEIEPLQQFLSQIRSEPAAADAGAPRGWARSARDFGGIPTRVPVPYTPPERAHLPSTQDAAVLDRLESVEVLSLDIFDTALIRRVAHPTSVFDLAEAAARTIHPRFGTFADLRFWAEREARNIGQREAGTVEIGLRHIYDVLQKELELNDGERDRLERLELDIERRMLRANPTVLGWYRKAKAAGKKTIFVSDMYLPSAFLAEVLSAAGYEDPVVYVSNEYGVGKGQLGLYEKVAADLGIPGEKILHLGDNHQSDKQSAEAMGWNAVHYVEQAWERPYALQMADVSTLDISNAAASVGLGLAREHRVRIEATDVDAAERIARHVGYEVVGPTALAFAGWVAKRARADGLDKVLFLARDGILIQKIYELLRETGFSVGESHYILASRSLLYSQRMLTLDQLRDSAAKLDFSRATTLRDYLDMFLIRNDDIIVQCASRLGIGDVDAPILDQLGKRDDYGAAKRLLGEALADLAPTILEHANAASDDLLRYYRDAGGIEGSKAIGLVDLGWSGSIMPSLKSLFATLAPGATMRSYFFGLVHNRKNHLPADLPADAYFFSDGIFESYPYTPLRMPSPRQHVDVIGACPALMEVLLSENTTTAIGLRSDPATGALSAVRSQDTLSTEQRRLIAIMHEEALRFARDAVDILGSDPGRWDFSSLLAQAWNRLLSSPDSAEASLLGTFPHRADAGGGAATSTLVCSGSYHGRATLSDAGQVLWPAGWFALLDSSERALLLERLHATAMA